MISTMWKMQTELQNPVIKTVYYLTWSVTEFGQFWMDPSKRKSVHLKQNGDMVTCVCVY